MKHEPIFHVYQDGDKFFAALPEFRDLQESDVMWLDELELVMQGIYEKLCIQFRNKSRRRRLVKVPVRTVETVDRWGQKIIQEKEA